MVGFSLIGWFGFRAGFDAIARRLSPPRRG
jgi:hypothetical protein